MTDTHAENGFAPHKQGRQLRPYNILVIFAMSFASVAMGFSASIIATTLEQPSFLEYFELATRPDATSLIGTMNGLFQAGSFFGSLLISFVADRYGRKMSIVVPAILVVVSGALLAGSVHIGMFIAFRFVSGMGSFWLLGSIPVWMTEIVPPKSRGLLVDIHSAALLFGYAFASWSGILQAWRGPIALQCLPALIVLSAMKWLPESPRWLIAKGQHETARAILLKLHKPEEAEVEFAQIQTQLQIDSSLPSTWKSLVAKKSYRKRGLYAVGLACGIQFTGVLVINNYGAIIYGGLGFAEETVLLYQAGFNTLAFGCGIIAMFIIDFFPRNKLVALGTTLVTTCLVCEAALVANYPVGPDQSNDALRAAAAMTFCYMVIILKTPDLVQSQLTIDQAFAQLFLDGTQYVYYAEIFPTHLRAKGLTIGMASISLMNVMWLQAAPTAFATISWKFYLCFIIPAYLFAIVCFSIYPNTRGIPLEELGRLFGDETATVHGDAALYATVHGDAALYATAPKGQDTVGEKLTNHSAEKREKI